MAAGPSGGRLWQLPGGDTVPWTKVGRRPGEKWRIAGMFLLEQGHWLWEWSQSERKRRREGPAAFGLRKNRAVFRDGEDCDKGGLFGEGVVQRRASEKPGVGFWAC